MVRSLVLLKADEGMLVKPVPKVMADKSVEVNTLPPIEVTESGITMLTTFVFIKAASPIVSIELGRVTAVIVDLSLKAAASIFVIPFGTA